MASVRSFLVNTESPYDPAIPLLGTRVYPKEPKTSVQTKTCTVMFIVALFTIVKRWTQPKCLSSDEWINKMRQIHAIEYFSVIKRNEVLIYVTT